MSLTTANEQKWIREGGFRQNSPIFAIDVINNLKFLMDTGSQITIIRKDCVPYGTEGKKERNQREFVGISGDAVKFLTTVELEIKLVDHTRKMGAVCGSFFVNDLSNTPNILGIDILRKAGIVVNVKKTKLEV